MVLGTQTSVAQRPHTQFEAELFPPPSPHRASFAYRPCVSGVWGLSEPEHCLHWSREKIALRVRMGGERLQRALHNRGDGATPKASIPRDFWEVLHERSVSVTCVIGKSGGHLESSILRTQITHTLVA